MNNKEKVARVGILAAMPQELQCLTKIRLGQGEYTSLTDNTNVCLSGIGRASARNAAEKLFKEDIDILISWGTAAALTDDIAPGTLAIPDKVITSDQQQIETDRTLNEMVKRRLPSEITLSTAPLCESKDIVSSASDKIALGRRTHAKIVDMESGEIARAARERDISFITVRAISDAADLSVPQSIQLSMDANELHIPRLLLRLAVTPRDWIPILRLARSFGKAKKTLTKTAPIILSLF
jgi:nucleoside phosphorylase